MGAYEKIGRGVLIGLRPLNAISLLMVMAASVVMLAKTFQASGFFFFDCLSHVITFFFSALLLLSEYPILGRIDAWFGANFPLLSYSSGLTPLGICLIVDGALVLGNLNNVAVTNSSFGSPFFSTIVAGGIVPFILGFLNIIASLIFRKRGSGITTRMIRRWSGGSKAKDVEGSISTRPTTPMSQHSKTPFVGPYVAPSHFGGSSIYSADPARPQAAYSGGPRFL